MREMLVEFATTICGVLQNTFFAILGTAGS